MKEGEGSEGGEGDERDEGDEGGGGSGGSEGRCRNNEGKVKEDEDIKGSGGRK